ncbi:hypothetical protein CDCA_CDCA04G1403 [Cyanidium caldarium]|uniref:BHLH domain-containing protein n=1 Tax=Cyanidium caldarium TaxID=2771 RepID=A0AAV9ISY4_CYACA|nr:hypothetical protein CDCA_CDCA04G1403 [Cyanidium caldarium]
MHGTHSRGGSSALGTEGANEESEAAPRAMSHVRTVYAFTGGGQALSRDSIPLTHDGWADQRAWGALPSAEGSAAVGTEALTGRPRGRGPAPCWTRAASYSSDERRPPPSGVTAPLYADHGRPLLPPLSSLTGVRGVTAAAAAANAMAAAPTMETERRTVSGLLDVQYARASAGDPEAAAALNSILSKQELSLEDLKPLRRLPQKRTSPTERSIEADAPDDGGDSSRTESSDAAAAETTSSQVTTGGADVMSKERLLHTLVERKRRRTITALIKELSDLVPGLKNTRHRGSRYPDKVTTLNCTLEYIRGLLRANSLLEERMLTLERQLQELTSRELRPNMPYLVAPSPTSRMESAHARAPRRMVGADAAPVLEPGDSRLAHVRHAPSTPSTAELLAFARHPSHHQARGAYHGRR